MGVQIKSQTMHHTEVVGAAVPEPKVRTAFRAREQAMVGSEDSFPCLPRLIMAVAVAVDVGLLVKPGWVATVEVVMVEQMTPEQTG